jgi:hypothetical protein
MFRRITNVVVAALLVMALAVPVAFAAPLPDNCDRVQGEVTCTTFEGPGNNQAGVGSTTTTETQGNTENVSPEPQDLDSACTTRPPSSQGAPNTC